MAGSAQSVSERLLNFVRARQQFTDLRTAWEAFLDYLVARKGADIRGAPRMRDLATADEFVRSGAFEQPPGASDADVEWFKGFERREDVLAALNGFLLYRGLLG